MTTTIEATFDGKVFCPNSPVALQPNTAVRLIVEPYDTKEKTISSIASDTGASYAGAILKEDSKSIVDYSKITSDESNRAY